MVLESDSVGSRRFVSHGSQSADEGSAVADHGRVGEVPSPECHAEVVVGGVPGDRGVQPRVGRLLHDVVRLEEKATRVLDGGVDVHVASLELHQVVTRDRERDMRGIRELVTGRGADGRLRDSADIGIR